VKCVVVGEEGVVFVRHTYGERHVWELPGGGLRRGEAPEAAIRREMHEELGIDLADLRVIGDLEIEGHHKRTMLHCFEARAASPGLRIAEAEIAEARWVAAATPPRPLGQHAAAILDLRAGP
jgi:8-oxo-dGTP pyrophosphatase MutT (NUDIX family)